MSFEVTGFNELQRLIKELEGVPQKVATKSARSGGQIELRAVKKDAPVHDGWLKAALKLVGERTRKPGKKVYEITFDRAYNSKLVKVSKIGKRSYYPVSQEFGWKYRVSLMGTRFTRVHGGYHVGLQYMKNSALETGNAVEQKIVDVATAELNKVLSTAR